MSGKATPRLATEARQNRSAPHHKRLIAQLVPRRELSAEYVVLAAILHLPELVASYVASLHPHSWTLPLHQIVARIGLSNVRQLGRVDHLRLTGLLHDAGTIGPDQIELELATLARVAELSCANGVLADAVRALSGDRQGAGA